jgi:hypothetical protein
VHALHIFLCSSSAQLVQTPVTFYVHATMAAMQGIHPDVHTTNWGHMIGAAAPLMQALEVKNMIVDPSFFPGLAVCRNLTTLSLGDDAWVPHSAFQTLQLLPVYAPHMKKLVLSSWACRPHRIVEALAPQLTVLAILEGAGALPPKQLLCLLTCTAACGVRGPLASLHLRQAHTLQSALYVSGAQSPKTLPVPFACTHRRDGVLGA